MGFQHRASILLLMLVGLIIAFTSFPPVTAQQRHSVYMPLVINDWASPFGIEVNTNRIVTQSVFARASELGAQWVRLNTVSWRRVQPTRDGPYDWEALIPFETELIGAYVANLTPIVVVDDSPDWATKTYYDGENQPYQTSCGAIRADRFEDFAAFMRALVSRYSRPPYNVRFWELGNEPDIDPRLVRINSVFGCWGDIDDPFYGGEHYGEMLKVITPAIKDADPGAQVVIGGLALDNPNTTAAGRGKPENFFEGILRAGAGNSFDIVAYHSYPRFAGRKVDSDLHGNPWTERGGMTLGKAQFLRETMARYRIDKPLFLNETGLLFDGDAPGREYFETKADYLVRLMARAMAADIQAICWYTLNGPGWLSTALLDEYQQPRPAYKTYQHFIRQTHQSRPVVPGIDYGNSIEAYRFTLRSRSVDVLWTTDQSVRTVTIPRRQFVAAYTRDGATLYPTVSGEHVTLVVGTSPIYIQRTP